MKKLSYQLLILLCCAFSLKAQQINSAKQLIDKLNAYHTLMPEEKLYLTFDRNQYAMGDTLWFKTYLLDANLNPEAPSKKVYVELLDDSAKVVQIKAILIKAGIGWGDFVLKDIPQGNFSVRAYTNNQQNFGSDFFFLRKFSLGAITEKTWLMTAAQKITENGTDKSVVIAVKLKTLKNDPVGLKDLQVDLVVDGNKVVSRLNARTTQDGSLTASFKVSKDKLGKELMITLQDKLDKTIKLTMPVNTLASANVDLQFMPEGGNLLENQYSKIAFKAINEEGLGADIQGKIFNNNKEEITTFQTLHNGMGNFFLLPKTDETYTAVVKLTDGQEKSFPIPAAKKSGTILRIDNVTNSDSILVYVRASADKRIDQNYYLLAQNGSETAYAANLNLKNGFYNVKLPKSSFGDGITHFTLFSPDGIPLNERLLMTGNLEKVAVNMTGNNTEYAMMDSIGLKLNFTDQQHKPLAFGSYSVSVTEDRLVKNQTNEHILSHYLLTSYLKGNIENAAWYFKDKSSQTLAALDNLLLAQGWIGYDWKTIMNTPEKPKFKAEVNNSITGRLTNLFNKPLGDRKVNLLSFGKDMIYLDTLTDASGNFAFKDIPVLDSPSYVLKIKTLKGKATTGNIMVDEFTPTPLKFSYGKLVNPWYINTDSTLLNFQKTAKRAQDELLVFQGKGNMLKPVTITEKKHILLEGMQMFAVLRNHVNEETLKKIPRTSVLDLLKQKIPGFHENTNSFSISIYPLADVVIDNISTLGVSENFYLFNSMLFNYMNAEDIKDLKVFKNADSSYIIIETRSGSGPYIKRSSGIYVYRPLPIQIPRVFYSPKYTTKSNTETENRATVYWAPNVIPDENGNAEISFFAGKNPGTYTVTIEGTDLNGKFAFETRQLKITAKKSIP